MDVRHDLIERSVAPDASWIRPDIFSDEALYRLEQERIFGRCWLLLGHESQLPEPGSFFRTYMGEEPILVTRTQEGEIRAFLNLCRHRGAQLCHEDRGVAKSFNCRYHGWAYACDGKLLAAPGEQQLYYGELDREEWGLIRVAQVESYKGLVFGNFDPDAPPLADYLGNMAWYLDILLDRRSGGTELLGVQRWRIPANWKIVAENHVGDEYHVGFTHGSQLTRPIESRAAPAPLAREIRPELGHGIGVDIIPEDLSPGERGGFDEEVNEYLRSIAGEMTERLGEMRPRLFPIHGLVFPTLGMVPILNSIRVIHPKGPNEIELWSYCMVDRDAPKRVKEILVQRSVSAFGPAGSFEQDDSANWTGVTRNTAGYQARKHRLNLSMGLGHEGEVDGLRGEVGLTASDINQRGFYLRWVQEMTGGQA